MGHVDREGKNYYFVETIILLTLSIKGHGGHNNMGAPSGVSTVDMERTLKSLNGYHEVEVNFKRTINVWR